MIIAGYVNSGTEDPTFTAEGVPSAESNRVMAAAVAAHPNLTCWTCEFENDTEADSALNGEVRS